MYVEPNDINNLLEDWENVLIKTQKDSGIVAYYAFCGVKRKIRDALVRLNQEAIAERISDVQRDAILVLRRLEEVKRDV